MLRYCLGRFTYQDGSVYEGGYKNNMKHGHGKLTKADGTVEFEGKWVNNKRQK